LAGVILGALIKAIYIAKHLITTGGASLAKFEEAYF